MALLVEMSSGKDHWVGAYGPLLLLYWTRSVEPAVYQKLVELARKHASRQDGHRLSVVSVALPGARSPSSEGRHALASLLRETDSCVSRIAIVREGQGFIASAVVSIMVGIQMLAKPIAGHKFFHSLRDAVAWSTSELIDFKSGKASVEEAITIVEQQRKSLTQRLEEKSA